MDRHAPPLQGVTVTDATDHLGAYVGRLLADLGAAVHRMEPVSASPRPYRDRFMNAGKHLHAHSDVGLHALVEGSDVLITSEGPAALCARGLDPEILHQRHPRLVHVAISPFGLDGPWADRPASDLTLLAAGGLLALAGEPDREPLRAWGEQTSIIAGTHATVAALIALEARDATGRGQIIDVSAQEAVVHSLENAVQYVDLEGVVRRRRGAGNAESGTGLFRCADGLVYLVGGLGGRPLAWDAICDWLTDAGEPDADQLREPRWSDANYRRTPEAVAVFARTFECFAAERNKQELFDEGQRRGISIAVVATPDDLLRNPQLAARDFFRTVEVGGVETVLPGSPYRFAEADVRPHPTGAGLPHRQAAEEVAS